MKSSLKILEEAIKNKKSFIVNYGEGILSKEDIKETAYYDESIQKYRSDSGIWDYKLLYEIAKGEVENTSIE